MALIFVDVVRVGWARNDRLYFTMFSIRRHISDRCIRYKLLFVGELLFTQRPRKLYLQAFHFFKWTICQNHQYFFSAYSCCHIGHCSKHILNSYGIFLWIRFISTAQSLRNFAQRPTRLLQNLKKLNCRELRYARRRNIERHQWSQNGHDGVSNHQTQDCLLNRLFGCRLKKNIKASRHWPLSAQMASTTENVSIWWRHHVKG